MCKIVFHSLLNFTHITQWFLFVPNPNVVAYKQNVGRGPWAADLANQKFWHGVPFGDIYRKIYNIHALVISNYLTVTDNKLLHLPNKHYNAYTPVDIIVYIYATCTIKKSTKSGTWK